MLTSNEFVLILRLAHDQIFLKHPESTGFSILSGRTPSPYYTGDQTHPVYQREAKALAHAGFAYVRPKRRRRQILSGSTIDEMLATNPSWDHKMIDSQHISVTKKTLRCRRHAIILLRGTVPTDVKHCSAQNRLKLQPSLVREHSNKASLFQNTPTCGATFTIWGTS